MRITNDDPNLKIRELLYGTCVHGSVESDCNELDGLRSVSLWTFLFLEGNYLGEMKAAKQLDRNMHILKTAGKTELIHKEDPGEFCLNKIQNGDLFLTEDSSLWHLSFQDR